MKATAIPAGIIIACLAFTGCSSGGSTTPAAAPAGGASSSAPAAQKPADGKTKIDLKVTADSSVNITYGTSGGMSQAESKGSWTQTLETTKAFEVVTLTVTNADLQKKNNVTCEILVNGASVQKQSGTGTAAMANCMHTLS